MMSETAPIDHSASGRKGKAVEHLVAASCILASGGDLNASTALVDDEGVDVVFNRRGRSRTLAVQVKSRFWDAVPLSSKAQMATDVRTETFRPRDDLYFLFAAVEWAQPTLGPLWLVPSRELDAHALRTNQGRLRFAASAKIDSQDQWRQFRIDTLAELTARLLTILGEI